MDGTRTAACLAVGTELLGDARVDRNSLRIAGRLADYGVETIEKRVVGDDAGQISDAVSELLERCDVVVVTGGLGPTADDVTREAVARAVGRALEHDHEVEGWIRERYRELGREMPPLALTMARVIEGSRPLRPDRGTAPGLILTTRGRLLAVFPGPPWELEGMLERDLVPEVEVLQPGVRRVTRTLLLGGVVESDTEERIRHLYDRFGRENVSILASAGVVRLVLTATGEEAAAVHHVGEMENAFREVLGDDVAGSDVDGLEEVVLESLRRREETLAVAESCTGGLLGAAVTRIAGASEVFLGGVLSYADAVKRDVLGIDERELRRHGAVSEEVARAMAAGVRRTVGSDWGVGITGIAGPSGGTDDKPVGLVHWAVAGPDGRTVEEHRVFAGDRERVREWSVNSALDLLRRQLADGRS
jgi:nicotinamide-nucleotide amidase